MDHGERTGTGFCILQSKLSSNGATSVGIQRLSSLKKMLGGKDDSSGAGLQPMGDTDSLLVLLLL
jgi:hypothetical protein